ncbi:phosphorylcholine phosphatase [Colletotrichum truncatum]|uniref:Phosphorylcholine phosphatase n=1 Tax=Colletotrichum truncatum TaxID=5467 RepID=A0ACC3YS64_COLTU|nr:phosphorylcholine phosphatase [Colletotrichum truncatum]KAF6789854.1 phosphorylcholine phosphatase [Colletotrichum truncatum]
MKTFMNPVVASIGLTIASGVANAAPSVFASNHTAGPELKHWPAEAAKSLNAMIASNANQSNYAVFDMDNTSYRFDLEESLLPFLESKGVLTRDTMDPSLKLVPFKDTANHTESIYSYYLRLCEIDDMICYPFAAQIFSGIPLRELKGYVDELMSLNRTISTTYYDGDVITSTEITPPKIFTGQVELYNKLMANGIEVYVITAASEELVRMVAADPKYGYNVKPENVIGVSLLMKNLTSGDLTTARKQIEDGTYDEKANLDLVMTPFLWTPATWMQGKWAAILTYINEWKKPILAGGDTPDSDGPMIFHGVDVSKGGIHLWINRKESSMKQMNEMIEEFSADQEKEGLPVTADKNWVIVKPEDIQ